MSDGTVKLLVSRAGEPDVIVQVPAKWKITFGYVNPAKSEGGFRNGEGHCLRLYDGTKLRAVMGNVRGFRDLSIPLARKFEKESGETTWSADSEGNFDRTDKRQIEANFRAEDEDDPFQ